MLFNKERRIKYLGFNDFWFAVIGILILSFVTDYIFNDGSFFRFPFKYALISWSVSLSFSIIDWLIIRSILIFLRKKYPAFKDDIKRIILFFMAIISTVVLVDIFGNQGLELIFKDDFNPNSSAKIIVPVIIVSTMTMAIYEAVYHYIRLKKSVREEEQAKRVIVQSQLDALRNQAQPHFLFNSLNTLRDIIDQNSKNDATKFVDKLSDVYRFILESGNENLIPIHDEMKFARSYIHIQKERFGDNLQLKWDIPDDALTAMTVPMSLQLLLENAIKHNVISKAKPLHVQVHIKENKLVVTNQIQVKSTQIPSTKLGLKNIEKRYLLIAGKAIEIKNDGTHFEVSLPLLKVSDQKNYDHADSHH